MIKSIFVKSASSSNEVEARFWRDIEVKIRVFCEDDSQIEITFFTLENDLNALVRGYLADFGDLNFIESKQKNIICVKIPLSKSMILARLERQKDIIQSCEQIILNDKKIMQDSVIMPFNSSRATIKREILKANCEFFQGESSESGDSIYKARIILSHSESSAFDTNPKNAIYKAIGKIFNCATTRIGTQSLLDAIIFLNFRIDLECLKILLLQKCTFIVCAGIPSFSIVRFAQKFGITLIAFENNDFLILTHTLRFKA